ncbi:tetratricopeptide (TPR) repeat protein [Povalibacter uvarum]|uniref:Tetratricopeptide (TPR) repeat protein n=1 Tax=Povalibacter uvarum TaxID=732238 RepID=A0A841HRH4_9GAMM|nr:hypothetical protein [Povalibacter uvarum]MBB6095961.1 tetratricopeptide (TPR) repeat protein [Povalibacter uvarum]
MPDPSPTDLPADSFEWKFDDAGVSLNLDLPAGWTVQRESPPAAAEGFLRPRLTASSADGQIRLRVAAAAMKLPVGLVPAVVYWAQLHHLNELPENDERWNGFPALAGWSTAGDAKRVGAAWIQVNDSVVELLIDGPAADHERLSAVWDLMRLSFRCTSHQRLEPPAHEPESWWSRAKALRDEGRLDEAIAVVERDGDRAEALLVQADLHMERLRRARAEGETDVARDAWKKAASCARAYAASATSGGEGAARSIERDRILAELGPAPAQGL